MPIIIIPGAPMPKPRGQRSDKWKQRTCMVKYWEFKDRVTAAAHGKIEPILDTGAIEKMIVYVAFPKSYKSRHREVLMGKPHQAGSSDLDNFVKGVLDTLFDNDGFIWRIGCLEKRWEDADGPRIELWC